MANCSEIPPEAELAGALGGVPLRGREFSFPLVARAPWPTALKIPPKAELAPALRGFRSAAGSFRSRWWPPGREQLWERSSHEEEVQDPGWLGLALQRGTGMAR